MFERFTREARRAVARAQEAAIEQDLVAALAVVGVPASVVAAAPPQPRGDSPSMSLAAKGALEHSLRVSLERADKRIDGAHILLALLRPEAGTVPRALAEADVDRRELNDLVVAAMGR